MRRIAFAVLPAFALALSGCGGDKSDDGPTEAEKSAQIEEALSVEPLTPEDLVIQVRVKAEECFGSAGCNVTLGIEPLLAEDVEDDPPGRWEVTYELEGDIADGTSIQSFVLNEGYIEEFTDTVLVQTPKKGDGAKIVAAITDIRED